MNDDRAAEKLPPLLEEKVKSQKDTYLELLAKVPIDDKEEFFTLKTLIKIGIPQIKDKTKRDGLMQRFKGSASGEDFKYVGAPTNIFENQSARLDSARGWADPKDIIPLIMTEEYNKLKAGLESIDMEIRAALREQGDLNWQEISQKELSFKNLLDKFKKKATATDAETGDKVADRIKQELEKI